MRKAKTDNLDSLKLATYCFEKWYTLSPFSTSSTVYQKIASTLPEFEIVSSMTGVGKKTCSRLIAEIGDIRRFNNSNFLIAYAGIDTPPYYRTKAYINNIFSV